ncbi:hypothetical protein E4656_13755 [Natronospirillum operosum]|uniref:Uncharacterized protein n=1 Tax=Natronospirillum operosum TaxID=2759953 RepID=A0A4Z0WCK6_9GAMM|nr:hypothetical protein [Natronospirillum operosum]TGG92529.1 hypothetical protein E4656_13755 [Natronospirillum operosum]
MKQQEQQYTVKAPFPWPGRALRKGDVVTMHPRQAKYLTGTHLEVTAQRTASKKASAKKTEVKNDA